MIEELRERKANVVQPRPVQVAKHDALVSFFLCGLQQTHLRAEIFPAVAVVDNSIDPRPKLRVHRLTEFFLPPKVKGQIGIQVRENDARQQSCTSALEAE